MIDRDRLNNADPEIVGRVATALADVLQDVPREYRLLGTAALAKLVFEHFQIAPQDPMTIVGNMMAEAERLQVKQFSALKVYLKDDF